MSHLRLLPDERVGYITRNRDGAVVGISSYQPGTHGLPRPARGETVEAMPWDEAHALARKAWGFDEEKR